MQRALGCAATVRPQGRVPIHRRYHVRKVAELHEGGRYGLDRMSRHRRLCEHGWTINPGLVGGLNKVGLREDQMRRDQRIVVAQVGLVLLLPPGWRVKSWPDPT